MIYILLIINISINIIIIMLLLNKKDCKQDQIPVEVIPRPRKTKVFDSIELSDDVEYKLEKEKEEEQNG